MKTDARFTWPQTVVAFLVTALLVTLTVAGCAQQASKYALVKTITNCREVAAAIKLYALDHQGAYPDKAVPDAKNSNAVFRQIILSGVTEKEGIFSGGESVFASDGNLGVKPNHEEMLQPGENH